MPSSRSIRKKQFKIPLYLTLDVLDCVTSLVLIVSIGIIIVTDPAAAMQLYISGTPAGQDGRWGEREVGTLSSGVASVSTKAVHRHRTNVNDMSLG